MIKCGLFSGKKYFVFGLARSGLAAVQSLCASGAKVHCWDDNGKARENVQKLDLGDVCLVRPQEFDWHGVEALVLSPGVPLHYPKPADVVQIARKNNIRIICDVELLYEAQKHNNFVAITGTNGKSTTTALIGSIFDKAGLNNQVGGNIGCPVLSFDGFSGEGSYVLEMSSYQLDLVEKMRVNCAIWLNISPDHLERHGGLEGYVKAKKRIFNNQTKQDVVIIGIDDEYSRSVYQELKGNFDHPRLIAISVKDNVESGVSFVDDVLVNNLSDTPKKIKIGELEHLPGVHNKQNIAASYAAAYISGIEDEVIIDAIKNFEGLRHRMQLVKKLGNVVFINDSKATNMDAAAKALACYDNIYWIAGGKPKSGEIYDIGPFVGKISKSYLIGQAQGQLGDILAQSGVKYSKVGSLDKAVEQATNDALADQNKAVILLSPACASFDQWLNFEARGDAFCDYVREYCLSNISLSL